MYNIIKAVIESKQFELKDILKKLETFWLQGRITKEQKEELIAMAQDFAQVANSVDLIAKIAELEGRLSTVESELAALKNGNTEGGTEDVTEYPEYVAGKWYYTGDIVMYNGVAYKCIAPEGQVCVWSPEEHAAYWQEV